MVKNNISKLVEGLEKVLTRVEDIDQENISMYYLGSIEYSKMISWRGLGSDSRDTFYVKAIDCVIIRNCYGEYSISPLNLPETINAKKIFQKRARERNSIRLMTEEEKKEYISHANKYVEEQEEFFKKQQQTPGWVPNISYLDYSIKIRDSLIENPTVYCVKKQDGKKYFDPTSILIDQLEETKLSKNLLIDSIKNYIIWLKVKYIIKEIDKKLDNSGLTNIINKERRVGYLPVPNKK